MSIDNGDAIAVRQKLAVVPQRNNPDRSLSTRFLAIFAAIGIFGTMGIRGFLRRTID